MAKEVKANEERERSEGTALKRERRDVGGRDGRERRSEGGIEADLDGDREDGFHLGASEGRGSPGFEQMEREVFGGAQSFREEFFDQAAFLQKLSEEVDDLEQEVGNFG